MGKIRGLEVVVGVVLTSGLSSLEGLGDLPRIEPLFTLPHIRVPPVAPLFDEEVGAAL